MKKGFTLIELLAVIVILAIIALIATPVILNIIDDARKSSNEQSINMYGKAVKNAIADYLLKNPTDTDITLDKIKDYIKYDGNKVECDAIVLNDKNIYLSSCKVNGIKVDYTYGKTSGCYISNDINSNKVADIGDKVTCGTESFYVVKNDNTSVYGLTEFALNLEYSIYYNETNLSSYEPAIIPKIVKQVPVDEWYYQINGGFAFIGFSQNLLDAYATYLNKLNVNGVSVNLMSTEIANSFNCFESCDSNYPWLSSMWYWIEGNNGNNDKHYCIRYGSVDLMTIYGWYCGAQCEPDGFLEIRPVVTIPLSNFN